MNLDDAQAQNDHTPKATVSTVKRLSAFWDAMDERRLKTLKERLEAKRTAKGKTGLECFVSWRGYGQRRTGERREIPVAPFVMLTLQQCRISTHLKKGGRSRAARSAA